jgi:RNA polymerase sigma factor FliA
MEKCGHGFYRFCSIRLSIARTATPRVCQRKETVPMEDVVKESRPKPSESDSLVLDNIKFAQRLAKQFYRERKHLGIELEEYVSAAQLGLCDAAQRFDAGKGQNFRTFSYFRIRGAMYDLIRNTGGISRAHYGQLVPNAEQQQASVDKQVKQREEVRLPYVFAKDTIDLYRLSSIIEDFGIKIHLNSDSRKITIGYAKPVDPETVACKSSTRRYLRGLLDRLPEREREVIKRRYYENSSFDKIRDSFGDMSKSWVSRLHLRALSNLKDMIAQDNFSCRRRMASYEG